MADMKKEKHKMPTLAPAIRSTCFDEVTLGYDEHTAMAEAERCLGCPSRPCVAGCPVCVNIPAFLAEVVNGNFEKAYEIITATNTLPAVCGRVCPQESQCESRCVRGVKGEPVGIGRIERFVADYHRTHAELSVRRSPSATAKKVAIIGSGPSGLACAGDLAKKGYAVTVFEALHIPGGVLSYGIPEFRLPKAIVSHEMAELQALGVKIECNTVIGRTITVEELFSEEGFSAVFIGSGAGLPRFMNISGENLKGTFSANEFLTRVNLMNAYKKNTDTPMISPRAVAVVGGGNVAMDAARCAKRLGAEEVHIIYRRSKAELPARAEEIEHAEEEGILFDFLTAPVALLGDENGYVNRMTCIKMALGEPDASGRRSPVPVEGSDFTLNVDTVIFAIGTSPNPMIADTTKGLAVNQYGCVVTDPKTGKTNLNYVYAGGDAVTGAATVILAMGAGKTAAEAIDRDLGGAC